MSLREEVGCAGSDLLSCMRKIIVEETNRESGASPFPGPQINRNQNLQAWFSLTERQIK